jgi:mannosyl-3-phosphoglycerate phosphatase family protein
MKTIVITDLDGSLLHPKTYSFQEALPALELLRKKGIPVIVCSSKTRAEIEVYRKQMDNQAPFVVENGGGIFIPDNYFSIPVESEAREGYRVIHLGIPYAEIRRRFTTLRDKLGTLARGFGDMTPADVASLTGLTRDEAVRAMQREYDEPFVFSDVFDERFLRAIEAAGLKWTEGRFFHITGNHDKGKAVRMLTDFFAREAGPVFIIGLGDSLNDLPFLKVVNRPVLIRKGDGSHDQRVNMPGLYRTEGIGPQGWNEAILKIVQRDSIGD